MNKVGELNTMYLKALKEIREITGEVRTTLPGRITRIRKVLDKLADDTWKAAMTAQQRMIAADAELKARREADGPLMKVLREHIEQVDLLSGKLDAFEAALERQEDFPQEDEEASRVREALDAAAEKRTAKADAGDV